MKKIPLIAAAVLGLILAAMAVSQQRHHSDEMSTSNQENAPQNAASGQEQMDVAAPAMHSHHMESGPHMTMTDMRTLRPGDRERAQEVVDAAKRAMEHYKDYRVALKDGYKIFQPNPKFGLAGSIATREECEQAGGRFLPHIFGWMIHVYPYEKDPTSIWAMSAKHDAMDHEHMH